MDKYLCVNFMIPGHITDNRDVLFEMMYIPPGVVNVGSPPDEKDRDEQETIQQFIVPNGFLIGKYPVTKAQYYGLVENWNPRETVHRNCIPVESISFRQANRFCKKISDVFGEKFTLPTEAEWVHACLAGGTGPFPLGHPEVHPEHYYSHVSLYREENPLTRWQPQNAWGVHGMQGYLWQWCVNSQDTNRAILKGGSSAQYWSSWRASAKMTNCQERSFDKAGGYGFRVKMELNANQIMLINSGKKTGIDYLSLFNVNKKIISIPKKLLGGDVLTEEIASEFIDEYDFGRFRKITEEAAMVFGNEKGNLDLTGLENLDSGVALALSKRRGSLIFDITKISDGAAKEISNHSDDLYFFRLANLSPTAAKYLSKHKGKFLAIDGLKELTEDQASELSHYKGTLRLSSVKSLTEKTAESLSGTQGQLNLSGLAEIGETEAHTKLFAKLLENQYGIEFKHLKNLPSKAAELIHLHPGNYNFPKVNKITDETSEFLGKIPGNGRLDLNGLKELSPKAAIALRQFQGFSLSLDGLMELSPEVAIELVKFKGSYLSLKGLKPISLEVEKILQEYQGKLIL